MTTITVHRDPWGEEASCFPCTRKAFIGIALEAAIVLPPNPADETYPQGVYFVPVQEVLKKVRDRDEAAYEELAQTFGKLQGAVEATGSSSGILLPFPFDCCSEVQH